MSTRKAQPVKVVLFKGSSLGVHPIKAILVKHIPIEKSSPPNKKSQPYLTNCFPFANLTSLKQMIGLTPIAIRELVKGNKYEGKN